MNPFRLRIWFARDSLSDRWLVLTVVLAGAAYLLAAFCLAVLTWDGAGYVFNSIQRSRPAIPNCRYSDYPFLAVVSLLSFVINDPLWLARIYGVALAVLPVGSLLLSFHFLNRSPQLKALRIWPVLGILLSVLPGQIFLVAEAVPLVQVAWAVWAVAAAEISITGLTWLAVLNLFLFFLHPSAAVVFAVTGGLFLGKAWMTTRQRTANAWLGVAFLILVAIRSWYALATANSYERGELTFSENYLAFQDALPSLRMLPLVYLLGLTVFGGAVGWLPKKYTIRLAALSLILLAIYGVVWAIDPRIWASAFSDRRFVLLGTLPLVVLGALHWRCENASITDDAQQPDRSIDSALALIALGSAATFLIVFGIQSVTWRQELTRFQADLSRCNKPVATGDDLPWISSSPLHHWASTQLSCVVQGKKVKTVFALNPADVHGQRILLFPGAWFKPKNRWFQFASPRLGKMTDDT
ncbi:MAG: hypothetical protein WAK31_19155 [Chthoniobacterales bacterium]